jgi:type I restriction enzyme S subunit
MRVGEWADLALGDVLTLQRGFDITKKEQRPGSVPVVSSSGIGSLHNDHKAPGPGVVIGRKGSLGTVFFIDQPFWPHDTTLWVKDFKGNDPFFCYLLLKTLRLEELDAGSSNPSLNRNHAHRLQVTCPQVGTQRRIAAVLSAFDELIEINERRIELLEDLARSIYREWFVRFRFPGHEDVELVDSELGPIPEGWDIRGLFEVADVGFGFPFKSSRFGVAGKGRVIRIRDLPRGRTNTFTDEEPDVRYRAIDGDILVGMDGEFYVRQWSGGESWLNQRVARLRPTNGLSSRHLMLAVTGPIKVWNDAIVGTTVAHLGKRHLERIRLVVAPPHVLRAAGALLDSLTELQRVCQQRNRQLTATRDLLLPRLVTGRLDISDVDLGVVTPVEAE